jgi:L-threonylcarbamoyladenylate synthase
MIKGHLDNDVKTTVLSMECATSLPRALEELRSGGLVALPTDTVYGLAALVDNAEAVQRLYVVKHRSIEKAIPILVGHPEDLNKVAAGIPSSAQLLMDAFWPGAVTLVIPKLDLVPDAVSRGTTIAVRMPDHPWLLELLTSTGPVAVTSANHSGEQDSLTGSSVLAALNRQIDLLIDGGNASGALPSTIVDCTSNPPEILRIGSISELSINEILGDQQYSTA